jgi:pyridoxine kinase
MRAMARVLILSSYVAASRVGGGAQALALARLGIEPILVPTVVFGRHPGHGAPGGAPLETFEAVLGGVEAAGAFAGLDAVITGHFSSAAQVASAAEALGRVRVASPGVRIIVDPIMGDADTGLYVREPVAEAIAAELIPLADVARPNAWELERLTGLSVTDPDSAVAAARSLGKPTLVSSVPMDDSRPSAYERDIGAAYVLEGDAWLARHAEFGGAPKGTGDLLTAIFTACIVQRMQPDDALRVATGVVVDAIDRGNGTPELRLKDFPTELFASRWVTLERLDG